MGFFSALFGSKDNTALVNAINEGAFLVDVRSSVEFKYGSVKGAVNIALASIESEIAKFKTRKKIVVFCRSGNRSSMAKDILVKNGFNDVVDDGNWQKVNNFVNE